MVDIEGTNRTIHGQPLGETNYRVAVETVIMGHAHLPIPVRDELIYVADAQGAQVAWPKELVVFDGDDEKVRVLTYLLT